MPWVLIHPFSNPVFHDGDGRHDVDALSAGQIAQIPVPGNDAVTCAVESPWLARLIELLAYQFGDVAATKGTMLIWTKTELVAVIGIGATESTIAEARQIANEAAHNFRRILEHEFLRQEAISNRHLNLDYSAPLIIVRSDGNIQVGSKTGWDALYAYMRHRPSKKTPVCRLPRVLRESLPKTGKVTLGKLAMTVYNLPGEYEILLPLKAIILETVEKVPVMTFEQRVETLTPSQRATFNLVIRGFRNKEIATELGISYNTSIHHVAAVLQKLACGDRLQLMATAQGMPRKTLETSGAPTKVLEAPDLVAVKPMPDLPIPAKSQRQIPYSG